MTTTIVEALLPAAVALITALAALIRAEAAHRSLNEHVDFKHSVTTSIARKPPSGPGRQVQ